MRRRSFLSGSVKVGALAAVSGCARMPDAASPLRNEIASLPADIFSWPVRDLMVPNLANSMDARMAAKPVLDRLVVDDMSTDKNWVLENTPIVGPDNTEAEPAGALGYRSDYVLDGAIRSLVMSVPTHDENYIATTRWDNGSFMGEQASGVVVAALNFDEPQDWSGFNRLAVRVYVEEPEPYPHALWISVNSTEGTSEYLLHRFNVSILDNNQWNEILWEMPEETLAGVTAITITCRMMGRIGWVSPVAHFHIGHLEMQRVEIEQTSGWEIQPHRLAFHHLGHLPHDRKIALVHEGEATSFEIIDAGGQVALRGDVQPIETFRGRFGVLDFSALSTPGDYRIRVGAITSGSFPIGDDVLVPAIGWSLNTMHARRCGVDVPHYHPPCHHDVLLEYNGEYRPANGAWHDASDTHQNTNSMHQTMFGMMRAYERLPDNAANAQLRQHLLEEIVWAAESSLRTRFGHGVRLVRFLTRYYSDNEIGNIDDSVMEAVFDPWYAAIGVVALAEAARHLADIDPARARALRDAALEDYRAVFENTTNPPPVDPLDYGSYDSNMSGTSWDPVSPQGIGWAVLAACAAHQMTGDPADEARAVAFGDRLLACQEQGFNGAPVAGYFYETLDRNVPLNENLMATGESMLMALAQLCEQFPRHEKWVDWYSAGAIHADFFLDRGAQVSAPFNHLPAALWSEETIDNLAARLLETLRPNAGIDRLRAEDGGRPPLSQEYREGVYKRYRDQYALAIPVSDEHRLRTLPMGTLNTYRTAFNPMSGTDTNPVLASAGGLAAIAMLRGSAANATLLKQQVHWLLGLNPFSQSAVYGVGYDFRKHFVSMHRVSVGSMSTGFFALEDDTPYWGGSGGETWGITTGHFFHVVAAAATPARVSGRAPEGATFADASGREFSVAAGAYSVELPAGEYTVSFGGQTRQLTVVGGAEIALSLDPEAYIEAALATSGATASGEVPLTARLTGVGRFNVELRLFNATGEVRETVALDGTEAMLDLPIRIADHDKPWGALLFVQGQDRPIAELFGTAASIPQMPSA